MIIFKNFKRGTFHRVTLVYARINCYLLFNIKLKNYPFKQSRGSLYAASIIAKSLCPTSLQCTYLGRAVCL